MKYFLILLLFCRMTTLSIAQDSTSPTPPTKEEFSHAWGYSLVHVLYQRDLLSKNNNPLFKESLIKGMKAGFKAKKSETDSTYHHKQEWFYEKKQDDDETILKKAVFDYSFYEASYIKHFSNQVSIDSLVDTIISRGIEAYLHDWQKDSSDLEKMDSICQEHTYSIRKINAAISKEKELKKIEQKRLEAERFLQKNKSKKGILVTSNGLQYKIIKKGKGAIPKKTDRILLHYSSEDINNQSLYNTRIDRNETSPLSWAVQPLLYGWAEALSIMQKGGIYQFYMSKDFLYGKDYKISYSSTHQLILVTIELIDIEEDILQTDKAKRSYIIGQQYPVNLGLISLIPNTSNYTEDFIKGFQDGFTPNQAVSEKLNRLYQSIRVGEYGRKDTLITRPDDARQWIYCFAHELGSNFQKNALLLEDFDLSIVRMGLEHATKNQSSWLDEESIEIIAEKIYSRSDSIQAVKKEEEKTVYASNIKAGERFLLKNAKNKNITTLESGLQYQVLKQGEGESPTTYDLVAIHYTAKLLDGTVIANSAVLNESVPMDLEYTFKVWEDGLLLMKKGAIYKFFASGEYDPSVHHRYDIPRGSLVIYEVELVDIEKKKRHFIKLD